MTDEELLQKIFEKEDFDPLEGKKFRVRLEDDPDVSLTLDAVEALPPVDTGKKNIRKFPFTLLFLGSGDQVLNNALYHLTPEGGEPYILYLDKKEIDSETNQVLYETVVN